MRVWKLVWLVLVVVGCSTPTTITEAWRDPSYSAAPMRKILVLGKTPAETNRRNLEDAMAATLVPGGWLHAATDHDDYWTVIEPLLDGHPEFTRQPAFGGGEFPLPVDGPLTNFEEKYEKEGRRRHRGTWRRTG